MVHFFVHDLHKSPVFLEGDEFRHCIQVLRKKLGDEIVITDGKGTFAKAVIHKLNKRNAELAVSDKVHRPPKPHRTILAVAPPKSRNRWEWMLEKTVETGVDLLIPFISQHSERAKLNRERAEKIMRSAALQSQRNYHPKLGEHMEFDRLLEWSNSEAGQALIAHFHPDHPQLSDAITDEKSHLILVGPEGDFSPEEYQAALDHGFVPVNLSQHRLRTETAAVAAVLLAESRSQAFGLG